jgi:trk system potassium uptake protein TrkH
VLLGLIQLGGLGILTFTTMLLISLGTKLTLNERLSLSQTLESSIKVRPLHMIIAIFTTTIIVEGVGAVLLFWQFQDKMGPDKAAFTAIFHAVSAFCNAGFSTFSDSLESFGTDYPLLFIFAFLIIAGGLGFVVVRELIAAVYSRRFKISIHTKLCLWVTLILLVGGTIVYFFAEAENIIAKMGITGGIINCFFQAVTTRTAGFDTIPQGSLTDTSLLITMILMFIGACPGSCGGGIKTTTFAVIILVIVNRFRGRSRVPIFRRTLTRETVGGAFTIFHLSIIIILIMLSIFLFMESLPASHVATKGWFLEHAFEIISAFGTVGLSMGITPDLENAGKIVIIVMMFIGRVGLLTLAYALAKPPQKGEIVYAEEPIMVG